MMYPSYENPLLHTVEELKEEVKKWKSEASDLMDKVKTFEKTNSKLKQLHEEEIKQLKDKVVLWKKDAEKSKEEAQKFREQCIKEANMKEKYSYELAVMGSFYEAEKERAKKAETEKVRLEKRLKLELDNSAYLNEKCVKAIEEIRKEEISAGQIITGTLEVAEEKFKEPEVFAVMKHNAEEPELYSNAIEAIERTAELNKEKDAYNIRTVRILKVK